MMPRPMPAPIMPSMARPAPMNLAASASMLFSLRKKFERSVVAGVDHVVEVDAGQHGEDEGLQEGHHELERGERDDAAQRQCGARPAEHAEGAEADDEAGEDLQYDVAAEHVAEQPEGEGDRADQEGDDLDRDDE